MHIDSTQLAQVVDLAKRAANSVTRALDKATLRGLILDELADRARKDLYMCGTAALALRPSFDGEISDILNAIVTLTSNAHHYSPPLASGTFRAEPDIFTPVEHWTYNTATTLLCLADRLRENLPSPTAGKAAASQPGRNAPTESGGGWMGDVELAAALGVHSSRITAFRAKIRRTRDKGELSIDNWQQFENRKRNEPQFYYRANVPAIVAMAKLYSLPE